MDIETTNASREKEEADDEAEMAVAAAAFEREREACATLPEIHALVAMRKDQTPDPVADQRFRAALETGVDPQPTERQKRFDACRDAAIAAVQTRLGCSRGHADDVQSSLTLR